MMGCPSLDDERAVSEIYGTFLIISVVLVMAIVLVGAGWLAFGSLTDDTDDDLVRQSMLEFDDRIDEVTAGEHSEATTMSFPDGSGDDIEANPEAGEIELVVETDGDVWNSSEMSDLLLADSRTGANSTTVGNLVYEGSDGSVVAYEGGAVWEAQGEQVTMLSEPDIGVTETQLDLGFVDISAIDFVQEGQELTIESDSASEGGAAIGLMETVQAQTEDDAGNLVSEATITLNITSEFSQGWSEYAHSGIDGVSDSDVFHYEDEDTVEIEFGTFGDNLENVPNAPAEFDDEIIYTGLTEFAPYLYNDTYGELGEIDGGFEVESTVADEDNHTTAIRYDDGSGLDWWVWKPTENEWVNAEEPDPSERNLSATAPDVVESTPSGGAFTIDDDTWTCTIAGANSLEEFRDDIDDGESGCLKHPVDVEDAEDHDGEFAPFYQISDFLVTNESGVQPTGDIVAGEELDVTIEGENVGSGDANGTYPVALLQHTSREQEDLDKELSWILDGNETNLDREDEFSLDYTVDTTPDDDASYQMTLGAGTAHDSIDESDWGEWLVRVPTDGEYNVTDVTVHDDNVEEGDDVDVDVTIHNEEAIDGEEQLAIIRGEDGRIVSDEVVQLDEDDEETVEFTWETEVARDGDWERITVETADDDEEAAYNVTSVDQASDFQVTIDEYDETVQAGENVTIDATVENEGTIEDRQVSLLRNDTTEEIPAGESAESLTLTPGEVESVEFAWQTLPNDEGDHTLRVETEDHNETVDVTVEELDEQAAFEVDVGGTNSPVEAGETVWVEAEVTNAGNAEGTQAIWLETFDGMLVGGDGYAEDVQLAPDESTVLNLTWETTNPTDIEPSGANVTVFSRDDEGTAEVVITDPEASGPEFDVDILETNSPVMEGDPLTVDANVSNVGDEGGERDLILEDIDGQPVNVSSLELDAGESETVAVDWVTIGGDAGEGNVTLAAEDDSDSETVEIEPLRRDPVDVFFVMDETGSMGTYDHVFELEESDLPYTVEEEEVVVFEYDYQSFWSQYCGSQCQEGDYEDSEWYIPGDTITQDDWESFSENRPESELRMSAKEVAGYSNYCSTFGCYDPYGDRINAAEAAISGLNGSMGDRAGVLEFDVVTNVYQELTNDLEAVEDSLRIAPDGGTDISLGLEAGEGELLADGDDEHEQIIILLTDGEHNEGWPYPEDVAQDIHDDITIYTVGFGGANEEQLQEIAEGGSGEGDQYWAEETDELEDVFDDIIDEVTETPEYTLDIESDDLVVTEGEDATVEVTVTNDGDAGGEQPVALLNFDENPVDGTIPESLGVGESTTLELDWDTTGAVDWDEHDGVKDGEVTLLTPDDTATAALSIEEPAQPQFTIDDVDPDDPVGEGSTLTFDLTLTNDGDAPGEQDIWIQSDTGQLLTTSDESISLDPGESTDVTIAWDTEIGDRNVEEVTLATEDMLVTEEVNITASDDGTFQLEILETNEPLDVGQELQVTADISNEGDIDLTAPVTLTDIHDNSVDMRTVSLDAGESDEFSFAWQTGTGDDGSGTVALETWDGENTDEETVTVDPIDGDGEFVVDEIRSNATEGDAYIYENQTLEVTAEVTNEGNHTDEQFVELVVRGNTVAVSDPLILPDGESGEVSFEVDGPGVRPTVEDVLVSTNEDERAHPVDIEAIGVSSNFDIEINEDETDALDSADSVEAGDSLSVVMSINVTEDASTALEEPAISLNRVLQESVRVDMVKTDVTIEPGDESKEFELEWQTLPGDGNDDGSQSLIVQVRDADTEVNVWVDETDETAPGGPGFGDDGGDIDIDIDDIQIS